MLLVGAGTIISIRFSHLLSSTLFRYLTVFRDVQQSEGRPRIPTEWNGEKEKSKAQVNFSFSFSSSSPFLIQGHEDDIVCMAVTPCTPQLLATGSVDGDICIWNTSSELFVRRLDQRKRHANNTQAKVCRTMLSWGLMLFLLHD